jgi:DNA-directed RNA polymerase specialized sigma24 family protein
MKQPPAEAALPPSEVEELTRLLEEHRPRLLAAVRGRLPAALRGRVTPEDVLSDVLVQAWRRWGAFRAHPELTPRVWLCRVVQDCLIEAWRRETRLCRDPAREAPWPEQPAGPLGLDLAGSFTGPSSAAARTEVQ